MKKKVLVSKEDSPFLTLEKFVLPPDDTFDIVSDYDRFYFIIAGFGVMEIEKYGYSLGPETGVFIPGGSVSQIKNTSDSDLNYVVYSYVKNSRSK